MWLICRTDVAGGMTTPPHAGKRRVLRALRWGAPRLGLALVSAGLALLTLECALRVAGRLQGLDYRVYLLNFVNPTHTPLRIWNGEGLPGMRVAQAYTRYPPFRPRTAEVATTTEYSVTYQISTKGWRDRERDYAKRPGTTRLVALGDSFTFGAGVAYGKRFTEVAADRLRDVEILNMGVPGYGLDQTLLAFVAEGVRYQADAVVVFLNRYVSERHSLDIVIDGVVHIPDDIASAIPNVTSDSDTAYLRPGDPLLAGTSAIVRHSYLLSYTAYRLRVWRLHDRLVAADAVTRPLPILEGPTIVDDDPAQRARTTALLTAFRDRCAAARARLIVVNIDDLFRYPYVADVPGVVYYDLADELHQRDLRMPVRFRFDRHYTADTHRFIGERLAASLRSALAGAAGFP
jgi:hypothetical protein